MQTLAIIGSGIAGLSCAYFLKDRFDPDALRVLMGEPEVKEDDAGPLLDAAAELQRKWKPKRAAWTG